MDKLPLRRGMRLEALSRQLLGRVSLGAGLESFEMPIQDEAYRTQADNCQADDEPNEWSRGWKKLQHLRFKSRDLAEALVVDSACSQEAG